MRTDSLDDYLELADLPEGWGDPNPDPNAGLPIFRLSKVESTTDRMRRSRDRPGNFVQPDTDFPAVLDFAQSEGAIVFQAGETVIMRFRHWLGRLPQDAPQRTHYRYQELPAQPREQRLPEGRTDHYFVHCLRIEYVPPLLLSWYRRVWNKAVAFANNLVDKLRGLA